MPSFAGQRLQAHTCHRASRASRSAVVVQAVRAVITLIMSASVIWSHFSNSAMALELAEEACTSAQEGVEGGRSSTRPGQQAVLGAHHVPGKPPALSPSRQHLPASSRHAAHLAAGHPSCMLHLPQASQPGCIPTCNIYPVHHISFNNIRCRTQLTLHLVPTGHAHRLFSSRAAHCAAVRPSPGGP